MRFELSLETLAVIVGALAAVVVALLVGLVGGTVVGRCRHLRSDRLDRELQPRLHQVVMDGAQVRSASLWLSRLPWRQQVDHLSQLTTMLTGDGRTRIEQLAARAGLLDRAHRWVGSRRWHRRLRGARVFTLVGGGDAHVPELLTDSHVEVRAQAADWVAEHGRADHVAAMLAALDGDRRLRDYVLVDCLVRAGVLASAPVAAFLERDDVHDPVPALTVAASLVDTRLAAAAEGWLAATEPAVRAAAARVVAARGDAAAVERLSGLLADADSRVRTVAVDGLGWLQHWPAVPQLAEALADPAFSVRRAAALALRRQGSAGQLYLRRSLDSADPFARDMARQVLSLPDEVDA